MNCNTFLLLILCVCKLLIFDACAACISVFVISGFKMPWAVSCLPQVISSSCSFLHSYPFTSATAACWKTSNRESSHGKIASVFLLTHNNLFNGPLSWTIWVGRYQKGKTNLDFTEATDSEWQWHQLGHMQVCTLLQTDNHASTPPLSFLQAGCPSCRPTSSIKALKANTRQQVK